MSHLDRMQAMPFTQSMMFEQDSDFRAVLSRQGSSSVLGIGRQSNAPSSSPPSSREVWERWDWTDVKKFEMQDSSDDECEPLQPRLGLSVREIEVPAEDAHVFDCVDDGRFNGLTSLVILGNVASVTYQSTSVAEDHVIWALGVFFLAFFVIEMALRTFRSGASLFAASFSGIVNRTFVVVILEGCVRLLVVPCLAPQFSKSAAIGNFSQVSVLLSFLRLLDLVWVVNLQWTETNWFQYTSGGVIVANSIVMGVQLDSPSPLWWWVNQMMLLFFSFEIIARIRIVGCASFLMDPDERMWNIMDFLIVTFGVIDSWMDRVAGPVSADSEVDGQANSNFSNLMMLVRMLRLLRILRLLKLVKAVRPLYMLAKGVTQAMQSIFWVLVLTLVTIYAFAILATRMIGHGLLLDDESRVPWKTRSMFDSIWDSMFTLFGVMNNQLFADLEPLLAEVPSTKPVFVIFTICSSWALLSVMTGVVSDHMMSVREMQAQNDEQAQEDRRKWLSRNLCGIFAAADKDGSGTLGQDEYLELLKSPYHREKIQEITTMPVQDLAMMFTWLDFNGNGVIDFKELLRGCAWLNEPINGKAFLKITHAARSQCVVLGQQADKLASEAALLRRRQANRQERLAGHLHETLEAKRRLREAERRCSDAVQAKLAAREELIGACNAAGTEATTKAASSLGFSSGEDLLAGLRQPLQGCSASSGPSGTGDAASPADTLLAPPRLLSAPSWARF